MNIKETMVIAAFPGTGKSFCVKNESDKFNGILDSDSSNFSWVKDSNGNNTTERNPDFPNNYIKHIKENIGKVEVIFVSSHKEVREALEREGIEYVLVYPNVFQKDDYINRYKNRGSSDKFVRLLEANWDEWINECRTEEYPVRIELPYFSVKYLNKEVIDLIKIMEG